LEKHQVWLEKVNFVVCPENFGHDCCGFVDMVICGCVDFVIKREGALTMLQRMGCARLIKARQMSEIQMKRNKDNVNPVINDALPSQKN